MESFNKSQASCNVLSSTSVLCKAMMYLCPMQNFTAPVAGNYLFIVAAGQGANSGVARSGGLGATVEATTFLQAGAFVPIIVGGAGLLPTHPGGAGGGGLSAVYTNGAGVLPTIVAGPFLSTCC